MKGSECRLIEYMEGAKKRFVIPVYQRNYDWDIENCKQLYDDLVKIIHQQRKTHFFGSIVSVYNPDGQNTEFLVIDGQQRLTTVSLLFLAMYNLLEQGALSAETQSLGQLIYETYLVDKWQPKETRIKLKPVKNDRVAFTRLFDRETERIKDSNLTANYDYFYKRIQKQEISIDELYTAICRLEIIEIKLNNDDNPQLIFESLNSTGLALSEGDKIRNYILMGLPANEQNDFYEKHWNPIEEYVHYDVSAFIRDYLSVKRQETPPFNKIYFAFKDYAETAFAEGEKIRTEELLKELRDYARRYAYLLKGSKESKILDACIERLNRLETTVTRPFFLEVWRLYEDKALTMPELTDIFLTTESYLFRRMICDVPTNTLNKTFVALHREIMRYDGNADRYVEKFKYALTSKKERTRFPDDSEFISAFEVRQVYLMNSKNKIYILERFENYDTLEDKDIYRHIDDRSYSIEHIMPQHLSPAWVNALGEDYEQIHERWLHCIANLTLVASEYNSKYSNSTFTEKKAMPHGFQESGIRMNTYIAAQEKWGLAELEARTSHFMNQALKIWPMPVTDYKPAEKPQDAYSLDDDISLSGREIARFSYKNTEQPVSSWIDMFEQVVRILHEDNPLVLTRLLHGNDDTGLSVYVSDRKEALRSAIEIEHGIYVEKNTSTDLKLSLLRRLFKLYDAEPADLVFYLEDGDFSDEAFADTRYSLRRRYWAYALPIIKERHGGQAFSNVNPTKFNWISGFFGMNGFSINCVANYNEARVEIFLGNSDQVKNKTAFDYLMQNRKVIEQELGIPLDWQRKDATKGSFIACHMSGVSIENETDWPAMAEFHAEWSKRFYDVMIPFLRRM